MLFPFSPHQPPKVAASFSQKTFGRQTDTLYQHLRDKSAANSCFSVAAWSAGMFCNFCFVKNHTIDNNVAITEGRKQISIDMESLKF
jgi:hypothetical protein